MDNLPPFPKGQQPPDSLARFQNNVNKIEKELSNKTGLNNERVYPKQPEKLALPPVQVEEKISSSEELALLSKPVRTLMNEHCQRQQCAHPTFSCSEVSPGVFSCTATCEGVTVTGEKSRGKAEAKESCARMLLEKLSCMPP